MVDRDWAEGGNARLKIQQTAALAAPENRALCQSDTVWEQRVKVHQRERRGRGREERRGGTVR